MYIEDLNNKKYREPEKLGDILAARENRWNENYIKQKNKIYCKKYKLEKVNIYEKVFKYLNNEIKQKIELNERRKDFLASSEIKKEISFFTLKKYEKIYKTGSNAIMKFLKNKQFKGKNLNNCQLPIIKKIKQINLEEESKKRQDFNKFDYIQPKIWDYNERMKFNYDFKKNKNSIHHKFNNLKNKLVRKSKSLCQKHLKPQAILTLVDTSDKFVQKSFSRNSYLVSLNYDFTNPIVI